MKTTFTPADFTAEALKAAPYGTIFHAFIDKGHKERFVRTANFGDYARYTYVLEKGKDWTVLKNHINLEYASGNLSAYHAKGLEIVREEAGEVHVITSAPRSRRKA